MTMSLPHHMQVHVCGAEVHKEAEHRENGRRPEAERTPPQLPPDSR